MFEGFAMKEIINLIQELTEEIEEAKREKATIAGRQSEILKQLQESFDIETIEDAENVLKELTEDMKKLNNKIQNKFLALTNMIEKNQKES
jgi:predicted transposase YdaD